MPDRPLAYRMAEEARKMAAAVPKCPTCKKPLIARPPHRRFIEDDNYVECANGHTWGLVDVEATDGR